MTEQRIWFAFAVVAGMSFAIQVFAPMDFSDRPETTFDTAPRGHAAVFSLLDRFEATPGRWLSGVTKPPATDTIWWIAPKGACDAPHADESTAASSPESEESDPLPTAFEITVRPWLEAGGTAVVWLSHPPLTPPPVSPPTGSSSSSSSSSSSENEGRSEAEASVGAEEEGVVLAARKEMEEEFAKLRRETLNGEAQECDSILGMALPPRKLAGLEGGRPPQEGRYSPVVFSVGRATKHHEDFDYSRTRILPGGTLGFFQPVDVPSAQAVSDDEGRENPDTAGLRGWRALWVEADEGTPLALERRVGDGRLIVVADARILSNDRLGHVDSAPFVFDWVRDQGRPWIDEHSHGVVPEAGTFRYLAQSPAWAAGLGLVVLGVLVVWRGHAWPTREVSEFDPDSPTLATFVDSVARLYSGTQDHAQVFDRYRVICLDRIRRALGLAAGTEVETLLASLRARAANWPQLEETGLRHLLIKPVSIASAADLKRNVSRLDDLVRVLRESGQSKTGGPASKAGGRTK